MVTWAFLAQDETWDTNRHGPWTLKLLAAWTLRKQIWDSPVLEKGT